MLDEMQHAVRYFSLFDIFTIFFQKTGQRKFRMNKHYFEKHKLVHAHTNQERQREANP